MSWEVHFTNQPIRDEYDICDHLVDANRAPHVIGENDTMGPVHRKALCQSCYDDFERGRGGDLEPCNDCNNLFPMRKLHTWKWYDFDPRQGDEPLLICGVCWNMDKHQQRIKDSRNARMMDSEIYSD